MLVLIISTSSGSTLSRALPLFTVAFDPLPPVTSSCWSASCSLVSLPCFSTRGCSASTTPSVCVILPSALLLLRVTRVVTVAFAATAGLGRTSSNSALTFPLSLLPSLSSSFSVTFASSVQASRLVPSFAVWLCVAFCVGLELRLGLAGLSAISGRLVVVDWCRLFCFCRFVFSKLKKV